MFAEDDFQNIGKTQIDISVPTRFEMFKLPIEFVIFFI
jgi:hypothetical protein